MREGDRFDRYVVEALLGRGGMGEVYRAYDERLRRRVALKLLRTDGDPAGPEAMLREARAAAALHHPNAVAVYDVAESGGRAYLTMELLEGRPLRSLVGAPGVPLGARLRWLRQAAAVLGEAHRLGLVHRDVKPDNMFVCDDGVLKLLDFGIAKLVHADGPPSAPRPGAPRDLGAVSEIVGTPLYMAPEHRLGLRADARSDQFAWGVVAFELCSGRHPRSLGDGRRERLAGALAEGGLGPALAEVVLRAVRPSPEARFGSMFELVAAWDTALQAESHDPRPSASMPTAGVSGAVQATPGSGPRALASSSGEGPKAGEGGARGQEASLGRKLGRAASDAELGVLLAGLLVALGLGAAFVARELKGPGQKPAASAPAFAPLASAPVAGPQVCAPEGPEHVIAEGAIRGATSLWSRGEQLYAYAGLAGPQGALVPRVLRLDGGRWQPLAAEMPGGAQVTPLHGAVTGLGGEPAFVLHNGRAAFVSAFEPGPEGVTRRFATAARFDVRSFTFESRGDTTVGVLLGDAKVGGALVTAGRVAVARRECPVQALDLEAPDALRVGDAGPPFAPLVAVDEGRAAISVVRTSGQSPVSFLEFGEACDDVTVRDGPSRPASVRASVVFHRGALWWARAVSDRAIFVDTEGGASIKVEGGALWGGLSLDSGERGLVLAWVNRPEPAPRVRFAHLSPGERSPASVTLAEGEGLRDAHVRATPGGAFVTWVAGSALRGRALRCTPR